MGVSLQRNEEDATKTATKVGVEIVLLIMQ